MSTRSVVAPGGGTKPKAASRLDRVDSTLESALLDASAIGDVDRVHDAVATLERRLSTTAPHAVEALVASAFARAAQCDRVDVMTQLLSLDRTCPTLAFAVQALRFSVCRSERLFPPLRCGLGSCYALRYVGYAAAMCVEHNALRALQFLLDSELLDDSEVTRCYVLAKQCAAQLDAPDPAALRPMLLLLLLRFPLLLRTHSSRDAASDENESAEMHDLRALESSLAYELVLNGSSIAQQP